MLAKNECLQILKSYNINSKKFEPTIYEGKNEIGICIDIKDSLFGYLTRIFTFNNKEELNNFLTSFFWYKNNHQKYNITLTLDNYGTKKPNIIYKYKDQSLTLDNMINIENFLKEEELEKKEEEEKKFYFESVKELTNYLINFKQMKENIKLEKNKLKIEENDLKFELLNELTIYYGKERTLNKKEITLDPPPTIDTTLLLENVKNIEKKSLNEIKDYLKSLINIIKEEELDEKNLINIYSNSVYNYNIDILKKQIDFVKSKINAEKNFNLKGSKLHNIDEELRSFLKTNIAPTKIEVFLSDNKEQISRKFSNIDLNNACKIITGKHIFIEPPKKNDLITTNSNDHLLEEFSKLENNKKTNLILYHSIYKPICNYIIDNNYPSIENIISKFDFHHYYNDLEEIVFNENNNHYLTNYFTNIDFKNLNSYINSIINICKDLESTSFTLQKEITLFASPQNTKYKQLTNKPNLSSKYLITTKNNLIFIPYKLIVDWDNLDITLNNENSYYTKDTIIEDIETITLNKYNKKNIEKNGIIITTDLLLDSEITFSKSHLEGENYG